MLTVLKYERKEKIMNELKKYRNMIVYIIVMILGYSIDIFICWNIRIYKKVRIYKLKLFLYNIRYES